MDIKILPLSITMMAGPQILFAILLVTQDKPIKLSLAYVAAIALAVSIGVFILTFIASYLGLVNPSSASNSQAGRFIEIGLVLLLIIMSIKTFVNRENIKEPKWMASLKTIDTKKAFSTGLLLIFLMPSDIIVMLTVGTHLYSEGLSFTASIPFIALTVLTAALPLLVYLVFKNRAKVFMPKVRDWISNNAAIVNIVIYLFFVVLIVS